MKNKILDFENEYDDIQNDASQNNIVPNAIIVKANCFIQVKHYVGQQSGKSLSLLENKIFDFTISLLDQNQCTLQPVTFHLKDFWKIRGIQKISGAHYQRMKDALQAISDKSAWIIRKNLITEKNEEILVRLIQKVIFSDDGTSCTVIFDQDLAPVLLMQKDNFSFQSLNTKYDLETKYGYDLHSLLCSYEFLHQPIRFSFIKLAELLDASEYSSRDFKKRVIEPAVNDINTTCLDIHVDYQIEKTGRQMTHIVFTLTRLSGECSSVGDIPADPKEQTAICTEKQIQETEQQETEVQDNNYSETEKQVKEQIGYDAFCIDNQNGIYHYDIGSLDLIVETMVEVLTSSQKTFTINKVPIPTGKVQERYQSLGYDHIQHVLYNLEHYAKDVKNPRTYIRSMLFNAPTTINMQTSSRVNADWGKDRNAPIYGSGNLGEEELEAIRRVLNED